MRLRVIPSLAVITVILAVPSTASAYFSHVVSPGESLSSIAAADGLTVAQLAAANGISAGAPLVAGSAVQIPPQTVAASITPATTTPTAGMLDGDGDYDGDAATTATATAAPASAAAATGGGSYVVQPGDTLSAIAARAGVSVASLAAANGLSPNGVIVSGTALRLAGSPATTYVSTTASPAVAQPVGAAAQGSVTNPPYPTPERVSASQIGQVAAANGVSPSLAAAVAWQESGFNNALVSTADARGVMQILPGTWQYIQNSLNPGTPLAPASAVDNVRGGVLLLHSLLSATGGSPSLAAAGYYQGLPSVQRYGLFRDTQQYVNSVMALRRQFGGP